MEPLADIDLRLIVEKELVAIQSFAQLTFETQLLESARVHRLGIELEVVAAIVLGAVHGGVGVADQAFGDDPVVRVDGDADAGGHQKSLAVELVGLGQRLAEAPRDIGGISDAVELRQQDDELVAAES